MGVIRKFLVLLLLVSGVILLGRLAGSLFPRDPGPVASSNGPPVLGDSTNALPPIPADTSGGPWREKLFTPLIQAYGLSGKSIRPRKGYWEVVFPKGKPIHEYALAIEKLCRKNGIRVVKGVELRPSNQGVEYHLELEGSMIKLRASLGKAFMAGSARLAIVFTQLDSINESQLAALEGTRWEKTLVVNPYASNPLLKKLRFTHSRNEVVAELPLEPSSYPYLDPGPNALFIHHGKEEVEHILGAALDSLPKAKGFASRYGDRAIENQPLLDKLFRYLADRRLIFLDLTGSPRSLTRQVAGPLGARYRISAVDKDSLGTAEEFVGRAALAQKTGDALWVVAWSPAAVRGIEKALNEHEVRMSDVGLELVTLSRLSEMPAADTASK